MTRMYTSMMAAGAAVLLLVAVQPAAAVMRQGDAGATGVRPAGGAAAAANPTVNREGFVQAVDMSGHTIVINSTRWNVTERVQKG